jgi:hypothetical protein
MIVTIEPRLPRAVCWDGSSDALAAIRTLVPDVDELGGDVLGARGALVAVGDWVTDGAGAPDVIPAAEFAAHWTARTE